MYHEYQHVDVIKWIPSEHFKLERGIKQKDHISPYICLISTEYHDRYVHFMTNIPKSDISIKQLKMVLQILIDVC